METILVPTDFSSTAENAANYALHIAKLIKTDIMLCNAMRVPAEAIMAPQISWPLVDFEMVKDESTRDLKSLADKLIEDEKDIQLNEAFHPKIEYINEVGSLRDVVADLIDKKKLTMVVMGMSGAGGVSRLLMGSNSKNMIEAAEVPVLMIPDRYSYRPVTKMAIATDLNEKDIHVIHSIAGLARSFCAELLIAHVTNEDFDQNANKGKIHDFLNEIACKINYHKIYYRNIKNNDINHGLDWLAEHTQLDMLAMVHRKHNLVTRIFESSYTQHMAKHIDIPLLVFPDGYQSFVF